MPAREATAWWIDAILWFQIKRDKFDRDISSHDDGKLIGVFVFGCDSLIGLLELNGCCLFASASDIQPCIDDYGT